MKRIDYTNVKLANATVIERVEDFVSNDGRRRAMWKCICNCGNEFTVRGEKIKSNPNIMCVPCTRKMVGQKNKADHTGEKFGSLLIKELIPETYPAKVKCVCDCGNEYVGTQADIVAGHTKSCGCFQRERAAEANTKDWANVVSDYGIKLLRQDSVNDKGQWLWECECGLCGKHFIALPAKIMNGHITSCGCAAQSSGERYVEAVLKSLGCNFQTQYSFDDCAYKQKLKFDFVVFNKDTVMYAIEYDGAQHYQPIGWFGGQEQFQKQHERDEIKDKYCQDHSIPLLRLPYTLTNDGIKTIISNYHLSVETAGRT